MTTPYFCSTPVVHPSLGEEYTFFLTSNHMFRIDFAYMTASLSIGITPDEFRDLYHLRGAQTLPLEHRYIINQPMPSDETDIRRFATDLASDILSQLAEMLKWGSVVEFARLQSYIQVERFMPQERYDVVIKNLLAKLVIFEELKAPNASIFSM